METFFCIDCKQTKPVNTSGGTGYASLEPRDDSPKVCYECCGKRDKKWMDEHDKTTLYLTFENGHYSASNWPGTLKFPAAVHTGKHNWAGTRYDAWFVDHNGNRWHGIQYGENTQILHCRKLKDSPKKAA